MAPIRLFTTRSGTDANAPNTEGAAMTGTNTVYSDMWTGEDSEGYSLTIFWTGTPTGTFTRWFTDKPNPDLTNDNDWVQDTGFTPTNPAGAAGKFGTPTAVGRSFRNRIKYVNASGAGTLTGFATVTRIKP